MHNYYYNPLALDYKVFLNTPFFRFFVWIIDNIKDVLFTFYRYGLTRDTYRVEGGREGEREREKWWWWWGQEEESSVLTGKLSSSLSPVSPTGLMQYSLRVNPCSSACALICLLNMSLPVKYRVPK